MLADENVIALNEVAQRTAHLADLYGSQQDRVDEAAAALFKAHAAEHKRINAVVDEAVVRLRELPADGGSERDDLHALKVGAHGLLSFDPQGALGREFDAMEADLDKAVAEALKHALPDLLLPVLRGYRESIAKHRQALSEL